ncbi:MAG TPA: cytochrome b N-terminal domain-containing protein [Actinocrinis sp.]|uniref:cytochrome b N-terminal domain-containing protein n=1 Tax=Actinocrinis sp. TaxID=1920516 RepID=UPI002DDD51C7|nr:cytochrome b N-terminal domain-containing protein [Actinocrinis sp.]HEV3172101.1 cytochrome b N-terminal domain-containing protein [Actinocrinis sp.]
MSGQSTTNPTTAPAPAPVATGGWTGAVRRRAVRALPPDKLLPDTQPAYMASWIYVFGVLTLAAFVVVLASGTVLALRGPAWWHISSLGHYINSLHLWSVELFMAFMVIHLWGKFFMAAWRGRRALTWITGAVAFLGSVGTAFTGYLAQQNFDSQWIATQAKDGLNAVGIGAYFNVMDFGQMLMWHIVLLPALVGILVVWHLLLVRHRGVVPPIARRERSAEPAPTAEAIPEPVLSTVPDADQAPRS